MNPTAYKHNKLVKKYTANISELKDGLKLTNHMYFTIRPGVNNFL